MRWVITHLLQLGHRGEDETPTLDPRLGRLDPFHHVVDGCLVKRGLLGSQVAPDLHFQLVWQISDDRLVGFQPAQDERTRDTPELRGRTLVAGPLDRDGKPLPELLRRAEQARAGELHQRPQVRQPVLYWCASQRDPRSGRYGPDCLSLASSRVLNVLRLVADHPGPLDLA